MHNDAGQDSNEDVGGATYVVDPEQAYEDITVVRVHYGPKRVKLAMRFSDMLVDPEHSYDVRYVLHTKSGRHLEYAVSVRDSPEPQVRQFSYNEDSKKAVPCAGDTWELDYVGKRAILYLPNACIHDTPWFRLAAVTETDDHFGPGPDGAIDPVHYDDGLRDGLVTPYKSYAFGDPIYQDR